MIMANIFSNRYSNKIQRICESPISCIKMVFPRPAPFKPKTINYTARLGIWGAVVTWGVGFWAIGEYVFDMFGPLKRIARGADVTNDPKYMKEVIKHLDEEAQKNLNIKHGYNTITAAQFREAQQRWGEARLTNEVREFFIKKQNTETGEESSDSKDNFTDIKKVEPGVYGKVVVTRLIDNEKEIEEHSK